MNPRQRGKRFLRRRATASGMAAHMAGPRTKINKDDELLECRYRLDNHLLLFTSYEHYLFW